MDFMMRRSVLCLVGWLICLATAGAAEAADNFDGGRLRVTVSILPQEYFVLRVGGDHVDVKVFVGEGQSPHSYQATPRQMVHVGRSPIYFAIGVEFERALLPRLQTMFPSLKVIDTSEGVPLRSFAGCCDLDADLHEHDFPRKSTVDPHIWLSPRLARIQAQTICDILCEADPRHAVIYGRRLRAFQAELDQTSAAISAMLAPFKGRRVYVFHPAFGYFLDEFGLEQVAIETEGKSPSARQLVQLIDQAKRDRVRVIFVQSQVSQKPARAVADAIGARVVPLDPLARDYLENLMHIAQALRAALEE
jgi:zinc transport system substrate-binding protein